MSRFGKCQNLSGCLLAYRGEETEVEDNQPFICAECGKPLQEVKSPAGFWLRYVYGIGGVLVLGIVALFTVPQLRNLWQPGRGKEPHPPAQKTEPITPENNSPDKGVPEANPPPEPSTPPEPGKTTTTEIPAAEPPQTITRAAPADPAVADKERKEVKSEVLTRIDFMKISPTDKDRLYAAVEKARMMRKILTIPFNSGKTDLAANDVQQLKTELENPDLVKLRQDPTAVFVVLGYADPKGDPAKNKLYSQKRADVVRDAMRDKCDVINIMHTLGMGGSKLLDAQNLEKNRIVEIWAVLP